MDLNWGFLAPGATAQPTDPSITTTPCRIEFDTNCQLKGHGSKYRHTLEAIQS